MFDIVCKKCGTALRVWRTEEENNMDHIPIQNEEVVKGGNEMEAHEAGGCFYIWCECGNAMPLY